MNTIFVVSLEPIETRYTIDWYEEIPKCLSQFVSDEGLPYKIQNIGGFRDKVAENTTPGAFLNFTETNIWKNDQLNFIATRFNAGEIQAGDKFLFTDAWNPGIIQLRYMSSLLDIPIEIHSIWHAGSYDPWDFLGRNFDKTWSYDFERSLYKASDVNYFATEYHAGLFRRIIGIGGKRQFVCGFPFDYLKDRIRFDGRKKRNLILFPHRISPEKQPDIFKDLAESLPEYEFVVCQDKKLSKAEYYELMLDAKMIFSANLQETLGISMYEGYLARAIPLVPDRLSYSEIWNQKYPSEWTLSWDYYQKYKSELIGAIRYRMENYTTVYHNFFNDVQERKLMKYFNSDELIKRICKPNLLS